MAAMALLKSVVTIIVLLGYFQMTGALQCSVCTYVFSGNEGKLDYDCVNDTFNHDKTRNLTCDYPKKCIIKTVYERDYSRLRSMSKDCQVPEKQTSCDEYDVVRPTCYYDCETDFCNAKDGDLKPDRPSPSNGNALLTTISSIMFGFFLTVLLKSVA